MAAFKQLTFQLSILSALVASLSSAERREPLMSVAGPAQATGDCSHEAATARLLQAQTQSPAGWPASLNGTSPTDYTLVIRFTSNPTYNIGFLFFSPQNATFNFEAFWSNYFVRTLNLVPWATSLTVPPATTQALTTLLSVGWLANSKYLPTKVTFDLGTGNIVGSLPVALGQALGQNQNYQPFSQPSAFLTSLIKVLSVFSSDNVDINTAGLLNSLNSASTASQTAANLTQFFKSTDLLRSIFSGVSISQLSFYPAVKGATEQAIANSISSGDKAALQASICSIYSSLPLCAAPPDPVAATPPFSSVTVSRVLANRTTIVTTSFNRNDFGLRPSQDEIAQDPPITAFAFYEQRQFMSATLGSYQAVRFSFPPFVGDVLVSPPPSCLLPMLLVSDRGLVTGSVSLGLNGSATFQFNTDFVGVQPLMNGTVGSWTVQNFTDPAVQTQVIYSAIASPRINLQRMSPQTANWNALFMCSFWNVSSAHQPQVVGFSFGAKPGVLSAQDGASQSQPGSAVFNSSGVVPANNSKTELIPAANVDRNLNITVGEQTDMSCQLVIQPGNTVYNIQMGPNNRTVNVPLKAGSSAVITLTNPNSAKSGQYEIIAVPIFASNATKLGLGLGIGLGGLALLAIGGGLVFFYQRARRQRRLDLDEYEAAEQPETVVNAKNDYTPLNRRFIDANQADSPPMYQSGAGQEAAPKGVVPTGTTYSNPLLDSTKPTQGTGSNGLVNSEDAGAVLVGNAQLTTNSPTNGFTDRVTSALVASNRAAFEPPIIVPEGQSVPTNSLVESRQETVAQVPVAALYQQLPGERLSFTGSGIRGPLGTTVSHQFAEAGPMFRTSHEVSQRPTWEEEPVRDPRRSSEVPHRLRMSEDVLEQSLGESDSPNPLKTHIEPVRREPFI